MLQHMKFKPTTSGVFHQMFRKLVVFSLVPDFIEMPSDYVSEFRNGFAEVKGRAICKLNFVDHSGGFTFGMFTAQEHSARVGTYESVSL